MKQSNAVSIVKSMKAPPTPGKHFRLLCMTGENKGTSYYLKENRIVLGRSEEADVKLTDVKASREHAELTKSKDTFIVTDLGSQNGIIVNDLKVAQHTLANGDKIIIGQSVFKFDVLDIKDVILEMRNKPSAANGKEDIAEEKTTPKKKPNKLIMLVAVGVFAAFMMLDDGEQQGTKKTDDSKRTQDVTDSYTAQFMKKKEVEDKELQKKVESIIHRGQREYREGNYFRAIEEFNLALVLSPNNGRASFYLNKTKQSLDNHIEELFLKAKRDYDSLRYQSAGMTYCGIMRMLEAYQEDERYKRSENQLRNVEKEMGMLEGEFKCFEE